MDQKFKEEMKKGCKESIIFFGNKMKVERERKTVAAFLRCLGIDFSGDEILPAKKEPFDIQFRDTCIQVKELLDKGRKRHKEYKEKEKKIQSVKSERELMYEYTPKIISIKELELKISTFLQKYSEKYTKRYGSCSKIDVLVYANFKHIILEEDDDCQIIRESFSKQSWRSVSVLIDQKSVIMYASDLASSYIKKFEKIIRNEWNGSNLFELEPIS